MDPEYQKKITYCIFNQTELKNYFTNCFFLSVASLVISFLPAANSSSLYVKSRTINLKKKINKNLAPFPIIEMYVYFCSRAWCLNSSTTLRKRVTVTKACSPSCVTNWDERGTTMAVSFSYLSHQSWMVALNKKIYIESDKYDFYKQYNTTYLGTITKSVTKYSESKTKCSFLTSSPRFLVTKLPL